MGSGAIVAAGGCRGPADDDVELGLLRGFRLVHRGRSVGLPLAAQRVLALLALHDRPVPRVSVAGALWPEAADRRAGASLRSALWRLNHSGLQLVDATVTSLGLGAHVGVDLRRVEELARGVLDRSPGCDDLERATHWLCGDILPDWPDDWVLMERERFRQLRLHALEALCEQLTLAGRHGHAVDAGLAAVAGEPLRESAHRAVITAHLAEGNRGEALRQYELYRRLVLAELGVVPSAALQELLAHPPPSSLLRAAAGSGGGHG